MTGNLSSLLKKYSIPVLFFVFGLLMLYTGISKGQDNTFIIAAVMMFIAGIMSIMYSSGKFKAKTLYLFGIVAGAAAIFTIYMSWKSVQETSEYNANYEKCKNQARQNLEDIRYIQKAYAETNGKYISDWSELINYAKNGTVPRVNPVGLVPSEPINVKERDYLYGDNRAIDNDMTEEEAYRLSKWQEGPRWQELFSDFKRDTVHISLLEYKFQSKSYVESRNKAGFHTFAADSLPYIPFTHAKKKWKLVTKDSVQVGETNLPAIRVEGKIPFSSIKGKDGGKEEMYFGTLSSHDTAGSWEEE